MDWLKDPQAKALLAVFLCIFALVIWKLIDDWPKLKDEARRERHKRKHPEFHKDDDD